MTVYIVDIFLLPHNAFPLFSTMLCGYNDAFLMSIVRLLLSQGGDLVVWIIYNELDLVPSLFAMVTTLDQSQV